MHRFVIVKHRDIKEHELDAICKIKAISWRYNIDQQRQWIANNIKADDLHVMCFDDDFLIAYLNLVNVGVTINGNPVKTLGVGNVCASIKGKGFGSLIMQFTTNYLLSNGDQGLLFCQADLVPFYSIFGWTLVPDENLSFTNSDNPSFKTMIFGVHETIEELVYADRFF